MDDECTTLEIHRYLAIMITFSALKEHYDFEGLIAHWMESDPLTAIREYDHIIDSMTNVGLRGAITLRVKINIEELQQTREIDTLTDDERELFDSYRRVKPDSESAITQED